MPTYKDDWRYEKTLIHRRAQEERREALKKREAQEQGCESPKSARAKSVRRLATEIAREAVFMGSSPLQRLAQLCAEHIGADVRNEPDVVQLIESVLARLAGDAAAAVTDASEYQLRSDVEKMHNRLQEKYSRWSVQERRAIAAYEEFFASSSVRSVKEGPEAADKAALEEVASLLECSVSDAAELALEGCEIERKLRGRGERELERRLESYEGDFATIDKIVDDHRRRIEDAAG